MRHIIIIGTVVVTLIACSQKTNEQQRSLQEKNETVSKSMLKIPLILPEKLENRRKEFEEAIISARERVQKFAEQYNWENLTKESFMDSAIIFDSKPEFDRTILELTNTDTSFNLPKSFSAGLEQRTLTVVSPKLFLDIAPRPVNEEDYYEKVIAHEIFHRLHIRIIDGDEDAMGSLWVFEGFAVFASNQYNNSKANLTEDEIWEIVESTERGNYEEYKFVFSYFVDKVELKQLLKKAGDDDFIDWLKETNNE